MKKRVKDELIFKTMIEASILIVVALIFWKMQLTYDYIPTVLLAPKVLASFSVLLLLSAALVGLFCVKKRDKFYLRYVVYSLIYSMSGFYIVFSQDIYFFRVIWGLTALFIALSTFYTMYRIKKV